MSEHQSNSNSSRHINQSYVEEVDANHVFVQTEVLQLVHKHSQYLDSFHQDIGILFKGLEFQTSLQINTDIIEYKDICEQAEPEAMEMECRTEDLFYQD